MYYKKILLKLKRLEVEYKTLKQDLKKHPIIQSKLNHYLYEDKESFILLWKRYSILLMKLRRLMRSSKYRRFLIFFNYNKLVILRYLSIYYFNILVDLIKTFGKHEPFIRTFLDENFRKDYGYFARYIYRPRFINLINTPAIFLQAWKSKIDKHIYYMIDADKVYIKSNKKILTDYKNIYYYISYRFHKIIGFFSGKIAPIIGHTKFSTRTKGLISKKNIKAYLKIAKPGDILITRGNWNASNLSIPGFWKHMSIYIGNGKFIKKNFPSNNTHILRDKAEYIIEATSDGINIVEIEHLAYANDYLGISRTNFKKEKKLRAIKNSLENVGKGYDYLFNFHSDKNLVCSELIMKSYAKEFKGDEGIEINLEHIGISLTYPPNNFVKKLFEESLTKKPKIFPVFFIDSLEKKQKNFISSPKEFIESRKRPKLSVFLR